MNCKRKTFDDRKPKLQWLPLFIKKTHLTLQNFKRKQPLALAPSNGT